MEVADGSLTAAARRRLGVRASTETISILHPGSLLRQKLTDPRCALSFL